MSNITSVKEFNKQWDKLNLSHGSLKAVAEKVGYKYSYTRKIISESNTGAKAHPLETLQLIYAAGKFVETDNKRKHEERLKALEIQ